MNLNLTKLSSTKFLLLFFFLATSVFSQEKYIKHKVVKGESFYSISKKYKVSISDIETVNLQYRDNLKPDAVLLIPNSKFIAKVKTEVTSFSHEVAPKETLYGIAKKYKTSIESIKKNNPQIETEGMKVGILLKILGSKSEDKTEIIPVKKEEEVQESNETINQEAIIHEVVAKETKYGISRKYGISVATLEKLNPVIEKELSVGTKLKINKSSKTISNSETISEVTPIAETKKEPEVSASGEPYAVMIPVFNRADLPDLLVNTASENIGTNYRSGGKEKGGFDCSGLMIYTFNKYDVKLPRTSSEQSQFGTTITPEESQKGDLIFFSTNGSGAVNHVGLITEVIGDEIKFIHSSSSNGVIISSNKESYYARTFKKINRVLK